VLQELRVENLLLMERAELRLAPGLNVLTGETGAGKTLLAHALDLLLGGRARAGIVREGAAEAWVEGVFSLPADLAGGADERIPAEAEELVLARRLWADGRTRAYVCGRAATVADLRELGSRMLSFYGQHESRKLMLAAAQLDILDGFCGAVQADRRLAIAAAHERVRALEARSAELDGLAGARERELDLLRFELAEIEEVAPTEEEERSLLAERDRLRHLEALSAAAATGAAAISPEEGEGAGTLLTRAAGELAAASGFDAALGPLAERLEALRYEAEDVAAELRSYLDGLTESLGGSGRSLEAVEERLGQFARLARKHGGSVADVLAHAERCRTREAELSGAEVALSEVAAELEEARGRRAALAAELSAARADAGPRLAAAVLERLAWLGMGDARFEVAISPREDGCGPRGADAIEFVIAPNAGLPAGPLREVASGGELSRVMLALLSVAHGYAAGEEQPGGVADNPGVAQQLPKQSEGSLQSDDPLPPRVAQQLLKQSEGLLQSDDPLPPRVAQQLLKQSEGLLVFDEIDAGVGGRTATAVGEHLRALAAGRQVLCITHLPQVAALAARHFTIVKDGSVVPARTTVAALDGDAVVGELVRMLGAPEDDRAARGHARELRRAA
jgi:DNA repair protein RecN (Recombination protein N)